MISKNQIKFLKSLSQKKNRIKYNQVILEGYRLIEEAIRANVDIEYIVSTKEESYKIQTRKLFYKKNLHLILKQDLKKISEDKKKAEK